jgi:hypothetical protein
MDLRKQLDDSKDKLHNLLKSMRSEFQTYENYFYSRKTINLTKYNF